MADYKKAMKEILGAEFSSSSNALHKNKTEDGYTYMGIYQSAHPDWIGWDLILKQIYRFGDIKTASIELYNNESLTDLVYLFYKEKFWDKAQLDVVKQQVAEEIFMFGVNAGMQEAVRFAQMVSGIEPKYIDGKVGPMARGDG
jgi:lysozyme family protein